jgi:hypothetical protein
MKKRMILSVVLPLVLLTSCGTQVTEPSPTEISFPETTSEIPVPAADGFETLGGSWEVGAVYYNNRIVDIKDVSALADMYDTVLLYFNEDGTYTHINLWIFSGEYTRSKNQNSAFLLTRKTVTSFKDGKLITEPYDGKVKEIVKVIDDNTIQLADYDPITGDTKIGSTPLFFVRKKCDSDFIRENKVQISGKSTNPTPTESFPANTSYERILNDYTQKMRDALPELISAFRSESAGINDIEQLALICNSKVEDLAKICNKGVGQMAEQMFSNGDAYSAYEEWAGKLMDVYAVFAMEIQDAYLEAALN